ncbi:MAG: hypothetical protein AMJ79_09675 [Phycisphaerae bacterium SM23_30]|nr:MAG: hypothetical protein AMJ79_09675 [Phycisphaerae bacterium SM23_30]
MNLLELCEPMFQYVCLLNRSARRGGNYDMQQVRTEIKNRLQQIKSAAQADPALADSYDQIERILVFFVDFMIKESNLSFAGDWPELAAEMWGEMAGDEKFFDLLEETLLDKSHAASQRLAVFYTCMGLGFTGFYTGQPEYLRKAMMQCASRIGDMMEADENARICPDTYQIVDTSDLIEPPSRKLLGIAIALVGLIIVLAVANFFLYKYRSQDLSQALTNIEQHRRTALEERQSSPTDKEVKLP